MLNALWITLIGMGLVFVAILLLWGLMALLVRLTAEKPAAVPPALPETPAPGQASSASGVLSTPDLHERRRRAAAAAVALALSMQSKPTHGHLPTGASSAWQAAQRAGQLNQLSRMHRKQGIR